MATGEVSCASSDEKDSKPNGEGRETALEGLDGTRGCKGGVGGGDGGKGGGVVPGNWLGCIRVRTVVKMGSVGGGGV